MSLTQVPRTAGRHQLDRRHRLLHWLQPGGLGHPERLGRRPRLFPLRLLPLVQGRRDEARRRPGGDV